ncbi:MAG: arginine N-succinyltransferase [Pirellula sp.]
MALIVREASTADLDSLWELIGHASTGMTSLKIDQEQLADRIERSHFAFRRTQEHPEGAPYVFVMQDSDSGKLVGTSCIFSKTGGYEPFYAYRVVSEIHTSALLEQSREIRALHLIKIHNGPTELGGLFLLPDFRGCGGGKLLSLSRFMYMSAHLKRFANETIAEMRGYQDEHGESPFWNAIGSHFFPIDFPRADALSMINKQFIEDLMPKYPIYLELMPDDAIAAIGKVHNQTQPALEMLKRQGFVQKDLVDIFDAGAVVHCNTREIAAVRSTRPCVLGRILESGMDGTQEKRVPHDGESTRKSLISTENPRFQCTLGYCDSEGGSNQQALVAIDAETAEHLKAGLGDRLWVLSSRYTP